MASSSCPEPRWPRLINPQPQWPRPQQPGPTGARPQQSQPRGPAHTRPACPPSHPAGDCGVPQRLAHEVAQQRVGAQEAQADVGGFGEVTQQRRVGEVHSTWAAVHQGHHDLRMYADQAGAWCRHSPPGRMPRAVPPGPPRHSPEVRAHLAILQRYDPRVLGAADDVVVLRDALQRPRSKPFQAVPLGGCGNAEGERAALWGSPRRRQYPAALRALSSGSPMVSASRKHQPECRIATHPRDFVEQSVEHIAASSRGRVRTQGAAAPRL